LIYFFNYENNFTGGGIIYKFSNIFSNDNYLLFFFSFLGLLHIFNLSYKCLNNSLIIILIFLGNPQLEIYHKYYEPMLLILFFTLFNISFNKKNLKNRIFIFYIFAIVFLVISLLK